jgi:hypothetical protein
MTSDPFTRRVPTLAEQTAQTARDVDEVRANPGRYFREGTPAYEREPEEGRPAADGEHLTELNPVGVDRLRTWLARPNGSLTMGRVTFEAVAGGGILVRTKPYTAQSATS